MSATTSLGESAIVGNLKGVSSLQVSNLTVSTALTVPTVTANTVNTGTLAVSGSETVTGGLTVGTGISTTGGDIVASGNLVANTGNITSTVGYVSATAGYFNGKYILYSSPTTNGETPSAPVSTQNIAWNSNSFKYIWYIPVTSGTAFTQTLAVTNANVGIIQNYSPRLTVEFFAGASAVISTIPVWSSNILYTVQGNGTSTQDFEIYITNSTAIVFSGGTCYIKAILWLESDI